MSEPGSAAISVATDRVTARWVAPESRRGEFSSNRREAETHLLSLLDTSLLEKHQPPIPHEILHQPKQAPARYVQELVPRLEKGAKEYARAAIALSKSTSGVKAEKPVIKEFQF